jgi:hypothetical protein
MATGLAWESVSWRRGEDQFQFEIERGGLFATLKAPGNRSMTLPMIVWDGLLDALTATRTTKRRVEQQFPARTGTRWYDGEAAELVQAFRTGRTIPQLAKAHNRTEYSIEHQLDKMGLFSKAEKYGPGSPNDTGRAMLRSAPMERAAAPSGHADPDWRGMDHDPAHPAPHTAVHDGDRP